MKNKNIRAQPESTASALWKFKKYLYPSCKTCRFFLYTLCCLVTYFVEIWLSIVSVHCVFFKEYWRMATLFCVQGFFCSWPRSTPPPPSPPTCSSCSCSPPSSSTRGTSCPTGPVHPTPFTREYWMIYRVPGFLADEWFGSSTNPSPPPCHVNKLDRRRTGRLRKRDPDNLLTGEGVSEEPNRTTARKPVPL